LGKGSSAFWFSGHHFDDHKWESIYLIYSLPLVVSEATSYYRLSKQVVESPPGEVSTFTILLPIKGAKATASTIDRQL
jgi:hypothetical protein